MTTVAYDGHRIASDLNDIVDGIKVNRRHLYSGKFEGGVGFVVGALGDPNSVNGLLAFLSTCHSVEVAIAKLPRVNQDPALRAIISTKGDAFMVWGGVFLRPSRKYCAIGSGKEYAMAAMACGMTASQAVGLAHDFDIYTGFEVEEIEP